MIYRNDNDNKGEVSLDIAKGPTCVTRGGVDCMLPWVDTASGLKYEGCQSSNMGAWCPTEVNLTGFFKEETHAWDICGQNCIESFGTQTVINAGNVTFDI